MDHRYSRPANRPREENLSNQESTPGTKSPAKIAILLMTYGTPDSLDEMADYLLDIRGGRPTPPALIEEIRRRYALIGGRSPLSDITRAQARALEARLNAEASQTTYQVYAGMRHWRPYIREAIDQIANDGFQKLVAIVLAPHYSRLSVGAYFQKVREACAALDRPLDVTYVDSYHLNPELLRTITANLRTALTRFAADERDDVQVVFTAHSLPAVILEQNDPYDRQLRETAQALAEQVGLVPTRWQFCYQSAGASAVPWLGPQLKDVVVELAAAGQRRILVAPIGFVADHVEILYDIDVEARGFAEKAGAHLERIESLNASDGFIATLADVALSAVRAASWP